MTPDTRTVTALLRKLAVGDKQAFNGLIPLVYGELHRIAQAQLKHERPGHTLQATALVHEVYTRMVGRASLGFNDRAHFLGVAAHTMRKILIDHARIRNAAKRDGGREKFSIEVAGNICLERPAVMIALDDALNHLEQQDPLMARLIELHYFGGLSTEESSTVLSLDIGEVRRTLRLAHAWLRRELESFE